MWTWFEKNKYWLAVEANSGSNTNEVMLDFFWPYYY